MKLLATILLTIAVFTLSYSGGGKLTATNADAPGSRIEVKDLPVKGKITIIDFYSDYCPPCRQMAPLLKTLHDKDNKYHVITLDVNRPKRRGIDWSSPLARQYKIQGLPFFMVYDEEGNLIAKSRQAYTIVSNALRSEL